MIHVYVLIPTVCALIGWLTNYIAVKMIFRPRRPIRILGIRVQGLMPRRQSDLARKIGETIESKLLTHKDIQEGLGRPEVHAAMERIIDEHVEVFFRDKLASNPMVAMFLQGELANNIKQMLSGQLKTALPRFMDTLMDMVQDHLELKEIVQRKIEDFDLSTLESIVFNIASRELKLIEVVGGLLGLLVGLAQVAILVMTNAE